MIKILGYQAALNVKKILWFIEECGIRYQLEEVGGDSEKSTSTMDFRAINPHCKVPVLQDGGNTIWESHTILRYLAAAYGKPHFWQTSPAERAKIEMWMDWSQTILEPDFNIDFYWALKKGDIVGESTYDNVIKILEILDRQLKNKKFVCGDYLTLADIPIGILIQRYYFLKVTMPDFSNIKAWYERLKLRPAYQAHVCNV